MRRTYHNLLVEVTVNGQVASSKRGTLTIVDGALFIDFGRDEQGYTRNQLVLDGETITILIPLQLATSPKP